MPLSAAIDIGSNTIRLLIGDVKGNRLEHVFSDRRITRLAEGIGRSGRLRDENIEASLSVLKEYSSTIKKHGVKSVGAVATGAIREADNSDAFLRKAFYDSGISVEVISGEKEAELIIKGIISYLPEPSPIILHPLLVIDIGGGSTEWILCRDKHPVEMGSFSIGVVKLHENFVKTDPVSKTDISGLNREILSWVKKLQKKTGHYIDSKTHFMGTAGTFTTLAAIDLGLKTYVREKIHLHTIPLNRLLDMRRRLITLTLNERKKVAGLEPGRADLIIPGILFTINIMKIFTFDELIISDYGLLEGVLLETLQKGNEKGIHQTRKP